MLKSSILFTFIFLFSVCISGQNKSSSSKSPSELTTFVYANEENYLNLIKNKTAAFIQFGFAGIDGRKFKEKYGIDVHNKGCLVSPEASRNAVENNKILVKYLNTKYGESWKKIWVLSHTETKTHQYLNNKQI